MEFIKRELETLFVEHKHSLNVSASCLSAVASLSASPPPGFTVASTLPVKKGEKKSPLNPIKAASVRLIVKHNHKVNVYLLSASLNSPNEPAGGVSPHSSTSGRENSTFSPD